MAALYKVKEKRDMERFRKKMGLEEYIVGERSCLKCGKTFKSSCYKNRICPVCSTTVTKDGGGIDVHTFTKQRG